MPCIKFQAPRISHSLVYKDVKVVTDRQTDGQGQTKLPPNFENSHVERERKKEDRNNHANPRPRERTETVMQIFCT